MASPHNERWGLKIEGAALESDIAIMLTEARKRRGKTQAELAAKIGISRATICNWELGTTYPDRWAKWIEWGNAVGIPITVKVVPELTPQ